MSSREKIYTPKFRSKSASSEVFQVEQEPKNFAKCLRLLKSTGPMLMKEQLGAAGDDRPCSLAS
jgi:hypothetical protein